VPNEGTKSPFLAISFQGPDTKAFTRQHQQYQSLFMTTRTGQDKRGLLQLGTPPPFLPVCLLFVYRTWPDLPGLPPPCLHTASGQRLEVGVAWEQGKVGTCWLMISSGVCMWFRKTLSQVCCPQCDYCYWIYIYTSALPIAISMW